MDFSQYYLNDLQTLKGINLTSGNQCKNLSEVIFKETGAQISGQTLRRVLGFIKQKPGATATLYSLNVMCRFLGFDSYNSYILSTHNKPSGDSFLDMLQLVYKTELQQEKDLNYHFVCRGLSNYCYNNPDSIYIIPKEIIERDSFQRYFIGRFPLLDLMDYGFSEILIRYEKFTEKGSVKLYVNSAIYLHLFKSGITEPNWLKDLESLDSYEMHPFLIGRFYGLQLHLTKDSDKRNLILKLVQIRLENGSEYERLCMLFTFLDFAITSDMFAESLALLNQYNPKPSENKNWVEYGYFEVFKIYRLFCLAHTQQFDEAMLLTKVISIDAVAFYFRKTYQLMYLEAKIILEKETEQKQFLEVELEQLKHILFPADKKRITISA